MTTRFWGLAGLAATCTTFVLLAQNPRVDSLPVPGLATPNFSQAVPRPHKAELKVPSGFTVGLYADNLPGARWMQWSPNGDLFLSQYNRSTITVLRDTDNDGKPNTQTIYANGTGGGRPNPGGGTAGRRDPAGERGGGRRGQAGPPGGQFNLSVDTVAAAVPCAADVPLPPGTVGIQNPMGMAFHRSGFLYVANTDGIVRYKYTPGDMEPQGPPQKVADLPGGGFHGWRNVVFNRGGTKMYVTVGSASNNRAGED
jgi:glucose/arabinose dehydrogenase